MPQKGDGVGLARNGLSAIFYGILNRTFNHDHSGYERYGLQFIRMEPWLRNSANFLKYAQYVLGPRPGPEWTLDRIDGDYGYQRNNLRWAPPEVQANNKFFSKAIRYVIHGVSYTQAKAAQYFGVTSASLTFWRRKGLSPAQVVEHYLTVGPKSNRQSVGQKEIRNAEVRQRGPAQPPTME